MTFTSPSTTGPFCRLITAALLPTSGNTCKQKYVNHPFNKWTSVTWWVCVCRVCETYFAVLLFGTHTLKYQLFLHNYFHFEIAAITSTHTWVKAKKKHILTRTNNGKSDVLECPVGLLGFTCYGVDADALDPEAFRWRQLSVELVLHNLVVPHIPALWFI